MSNTFATLPVMAGDDVPAGPVDPIFNRLLKDRIIWMGEEVKDDMANRICAQLLMLAAEQPRRLCHRRHGHLRHHAAHRA